MRSNSTPLFPTYKYLVFLMLLVLPSTISLFGQTISPQKLPFDKICAGGPHPTIPGAVFNEYQATFGVDGFDPSATFVVELSDPSGSFATTQTATVALAPLAGTPPDTPAVKTLTFAVPTDLIGSDTYRLRVVSSTGDPSQPFTIFGTTSEKFFSAYFKPYSESFFINDKKPSVSFCSGGSVTLEVYNPTPLIKDSSPANFGNLKYNWYKDGVLIAGQTGKKLVINAGGEYYAELDYGPCSDVNFRSQAIVAISAGGGGGGGATITSSLGNPFCPSQKTTLTATTGNSYIWKVNGTTIDGADSQTYTTDIIGLYTCEVDLGGCNATGTIDLKTGGTITANGATVAEGQVLTLLDGDVITAAATTADLNSTYQWYLNNVAITGATLSTFDITVVGSYKVTISGCDLSFRVSDNKPVANIPNILTTSYSTWIIPDIYNNTNTQVMILSSLGEIVFQTNNYDNYNPWPQKSIEFKNYNPVYYYIITPTGGSAKKGSITLVK